MFDKARAFKRESRSPAILGESAAVLRIVPQRWSRPARRAVGLSLLLCLGFALPALLAPWIAPHDPWALDLIGTLMPSDMTHWLGRDEQGADILSRLIFGARISLIVGLGSVICSAIVGTLTGLLAALLGGWVEHLLMRLVDVLLAFPGLLLAIALAAALGPGVGNVVFALSVLGWTGFARLVRGQARALLPLDYVQAARALGAGPWRLIFAHLLPNLLPVLLVQASFAIAAAILAEASLSFLGLGAPPGTPSWGSMLAQGRHVLLEAPHVSLYPGLAIMAAVLGFNLLGDALSDCLRPQAHR